MAGSACDLAVAVVDLDDVFTTLHQRKPPRGAMTMALVALLFGVVACSDTSNPLAPYEGERPLQFLRITQSFQPQVQWVGGRVAAVGVNRGETAALDSTLAWLMVADGEKISSHVTVGIDGDEGLVAQYGGSAADSLRDGATYTFWMAEQDMLDAGLDPSADDGFNFADTTLGLDLLLRGRSLGGVDVEIVISREETLDDTRYIVRWTPAHVSFRQIGITQGRVGGFTDLAWHVVVPDSVDAGILPPLVIGDVPEMAAEVVPWSSFEPATYNYWMTTREWDGNFGPRSQGYAYFQVFENNFQE